MQVSAKGCLEELVRVTYSARKEERHRASEMVRNYGKLMRDMYDEDDVEANRLGVAMALEGLADRIESGE